MRELDSIECSIIIGCNTAVWIRQRRMVFREEHNHMGWEDLFFGKKIFTHHYFVAQFSILHIPKRLDEGKRQTSPLPYNGKRTFALGTMLVHRIEQRDVLRRRSLAHT